MPAEPAAESAAESAIGELRRRLRRRARKAVLGGSLEALARVGSLHPLARPERHNVEVLRDIPYTDSGRRAHLLDVYRPLEAAGPLPVVFYIHGGGFSQLSKNTHWIMGLAFARAGYLVVNCSYRLAPRHPYPAALIDVAAAYRWTVMHAAELGGDVDRLVVAGESAGANLACAVTVAACYRRPEPFAAEIFETGVTPRATLPACGMLQVSSPHRFWNRRPLPGWVRLVLSDVSSSYLRQADPDQPGGLELADPLVIFERGDRPSRPLPPFFAGCGTRDPLLPDTRRLARAISRLGGTCRAAIYADEVHAFHALVWRRQAQAMWRETFEFLEEHGVGAALPTRRARHM